MQWTKNYRNKAYKNFKMEKSINCHPWIAKKVPSIYSYTFQHLSNDLKPQIHAMKSQYISEDSLLQGAF